MYKNKEASVVHPKITPKCSLPARSWHIPNRTQNMMGPDKSASSWRSGFMRKGFKTVIVLRMICGMLIPSSATSQNKGISLCTFQLWRTLPMQVEEKGIPWVVSDSCYDRWLLLLELYSRPQASSSSAQGLGLHSNESGDAQNHNQNNQR
jgi:hypothetical protein